MIGNHPIQIRLLAEDLICHRRSDEQKRFLASQRRGKIDPNPHQIDAVIFALRRIPEGGCILADEVGLGKTIEAGLVIAQLLSEGTKRILLILPKSLIGQWRDELYTLFGIETRIGTKEIDSFDGSGVFLVGREMAGGEHLSNILRTIKPFELCIIDEAHELFAGIHKRYDRDGNYKEQAKEAQIAHRVRSFLGPTTSVLLLTATPIQNSLLELWSLIQYVDSSNTLLGSLPTFKQLFCNKDPRRVISGQESELRNRIKKICKRTLRRQAQPFLQQPFVERQAQLFEYSMLPEEKELYDEVTEYLLDRKSYAFQGNHRILLVIIFHRLMASSHRALTNALEKILERLTSYIEKPELKFTQNLFNDIEMDYGGDLSTDRENDPESPDENYVVYIKDEIIKVKNFIKKANTIEVDSKSRCLIKVMKIITERLENDKGSGKVVIFTEFITTQEYIRDVLIAQGFKLEEITLFRGNNDSKRAREALSNWNSEVGEHLSPSNKPPNDIAIRLALVHEFKTKSRIFISTEAGAKGLNLQFCETLINFDLPWNPQRIEQRIGRCHRYGQKHDITVINFINRDNETQRLILDILCIKLELFGKVLDASDAVLHNPSGTAQDNIASAPGIVELEHRLRKIHEQSKTQEEIQEELICLRDTIEEEKIRFENTLLSTANLIQSEFDKEVQKVFQKIQDDLPQTLSQLDSDLDRLLCDYLNSINTLYDRKVNDKRIHFCLNPSVLLPDLYKSGIEVIAGHSGDFDDVDSLHSDHPLIHEAINSIQKRTSRNFIVQFILPKNGENKYFKAFDKGRISITKVRYNGFEIEEYLLITMLVDGRDQLVPQNIVKKLLTYEIIDVHKLNSAVESSQEVLDSAVLESVFLMEQDISKRNQIRFEEIMDQLERYIDDQLFVMQQKINIEKLLLEKSESKKNNSLGTLKRKNYAIETQKIKDKISRLEENIMSLENHDDNIYVRAREDAYNRRYISPQISPILTLEFEIQ